MHKITRRHRNRECEPPVVKGDLALWEWLALAGFLLFLLLMFFELAAGMGSAVSD